MIRIRQKLPNGSGYVLIPVMLLLSVIAAVAYLMNVEGAINANDASRELDAINARFVAEAGYTEAQWHLAQNSTCSGYTGLSATAFGGSSYSVSVSPTDGSPVLLSAKASMPSGAANVMTRTTAIYQAPELLSLLLGGVGEDTYLRDGGSKHKNFGVSDVLKINSEGDEEVSLLRFDLARLPRHTRIISATLTLHLQGGNDIVDGRIDLHRVTRAWFEGNDNGSVPWTPGATHRMWDGSGFSEYWSSPGGDYDAAPADSLAITPLIIGDYQWDMSELVRSWVSGTQSNYGILLRAGAGHVHDIEFRSSDHIAQGSRPRLTINYACECGQLCSSESGANLLVSPAAPTFLAGVDTKDGAIAEYDSVADIAGIVFTDDKIQPANLNAVHQLSNGHFVLSAATGATINGFNFAPGDLAEYNPETDSASLYLNAMLFSSPTNIEALHLLDDGHLLLSTATDATIGGLSFTPDDVIEYDPVADSATLFFDGALFDIAFPATSIDALHLLSNGHLLLSTDSNAEVGGFAFTATDLIDYDPVADEASIYTAVFDPGVDLDALGQVDDSSPVPPAPAKPALCAGTFLDSLHTRSYAESDGNSNWSTDWLESGAESDGPTLGDIQVSEDLDGYRLRMKDKNRVITREADLSSFATATLSYDYRRQGLDTVADLVKVKVSKLGGGWRNLQQIKGSGTDATYQSSSWVIDGEILATTQIEIETSPSLGNNDIVYFDNIMICAEN